MTKKEFEEGSFTIDELYGFCNDAENWDPFDELLSADTIEDEINEMLSDAWSNMHDWKDLRDALNEVDLDGSWYTRSDWGWFSYTCVDDDEYFIEDLKHRVKEVLEDCDWFDLDEEESDEDRVAENPNWFEDLDSVDLAMLF